MAGRAESTRLVLPVVASRPRVPFTPTPAASNAPSVHGSVPPLPVVGKLLVYWLIVSKSKKTAPIGRTESVATELVTEPAQLVTTTWSKPPSLVQLRADTVREAVVAPENWPPLARMLPL